MTYEAFKTLVQRDIKKYLPDRYQEAEVHILSYHTANDTRVDSLCIRQPGADSSPSIKIGEFYWELEGKDERLPLVLARIADLQLEADKNNKINVNEIKARLTDKERILSSVELRLANADKSRRMLDAVPHTVHDIWAFYYYVPTEAHGIKAGIIITNEIQKLSGVRAEELHEAAMANTQKNNPVSLEQTPLSILSPIPMYILSNRQKSFGAVSLFYPGVMEDIAEKMGGDYVMLPSSVHEVMLVPAGEVEDISIYSDMVRSVNQQTLKEHALQPEEVLGDGAFYYDSLEKRLMSVEEKISRDMDLKAVKQNNGALEYVKNQPSQECKEHEKVSGSIGNITDKKAAEETPRQQDRPMPKPAPPAARGPRL